MKIFTLKDIINTLIALLPVAWIFFALIKLKLPSYKTSLIALAGAMILAFAIFGLTLSETAAAALEGLALGFWPIVWVILAAMFTYNLSVSSGSMITIKNLLTQISPDRRVQVLILAFAFGGFLEAVAGFGTAVAIPAGIMVAVGFEPLLATTLCLLANTIPVAFGVVGIPIITLAKITDLSLNVLTTFTSLQLFPFAVFLPLLLVALVSGSVRQMKGSIGISIATGLAFAVGQTIIAVFIGPELAAIGGSLLSLIMIFIWTQIKPIRIRNNQISEHPLEHPVTKLSAETAVFLASDSASFSEKEKQIGTGISLKTGIPIKDGLLATCPYIIMLALILITRMIPALKFLNKYPFELELKIYPGITGKSISFSLLTNPGTIIFISAIIGGMFQRVSMKRMAKCFIDTLKQMKFTVITVVSIVSFARVMSYSGMTAKMALTLALLAGGMFPLFAPLLGALGTFLTGSDTSSNVLFGELQKQTAIKIGADPSWIAAANASGATAGKMISPQSISIAVSATGLSGKESVIIGRTIKFAIIFIILLGIFVLLTQKLIPSLIKFVNIPML